MTFGDLGAMYDGPHATPTRRDEGPYFLNISSLNAGRLDLAQSDHVSEEEYAKWTRRVTPMPGDLLFSYETRLGEAALMPSGVRACLGRRMALLRPDRAVVDPRFLLYFYLSPDFQRTIGERSIHGATVERILLSTMADWPVRLPTLPIQRAIAEVLGALDDKIAANQKVTAAVTGLVDLLHASAKRSAILEGRTFDEVAVIGGGGTPSTKVAEYWDGDIPWATPTDVTGLSAPYLDSTTRQITAEGFARCSSDLHPVDSILMTSRATIGAFALAKVPVAVNQGFIVANARDPRAQLWLYHEMRGRVDDFLSHANGATFLELSKSKFKAIEVKWPLDPSVFDRFDEAIRPTHARAYAASVESRRLAELRDTLLPHLMSGRLSVREAEAQAEAVL